MTEPHDISSADLETFLRAVRIIHNIILMIEIGLILWLAAEIYKSAGAC